MQDRICPLWPLALAAGLAPAIGVAVALVLSMQLGLVPSCNPFVEGCVSISRAARHDLPNHIFRALALPAAALQGLMWLAAAVWLRRTDDLSARGARWFAAAGFVAAVFLVLYGTFLGTEGEIYRWLRRFGIVFYFGLTCICLIVTVGHIERAARRRQPGLSLVFGRLMLALAMLLLTLGMLSAFAPLMFPDIDERDRFGNVLEWHGGALITLFFIGLAHAWRRTQFVARL